MDLADIILSILETQPYISDANLQVLLRQQCDFTDLQRMEGINQLIKQYKISLREQNGELFYQLLNSDDANVLAQLNAEEHIVLQLLREAGNKGMFNIGIKTKTGIATAQVNKILKKLEQFKLVKSYRTAQAKKHLVWMLAELSPSDEVTGGFLVADGSFDQNMFVELAHHAKAFLSDNVGDIKSLQDYLRRKVSGQLTDANIQQVVKSMLAIEDIEEIGKGRYRTNIMSVPTPTSAPCLSCPFIRECRVGSVINPVDCEYLEEWLGN